MRRLEQDKIEVVILVAIYTSTIHVYFRICKEKGWHTLSIFWTLLHEVQRGHPKHLAANISCSLSDVGSFWQQHLQVLLDKSFCWYVAIYFADSVEKKKKKKVVYVLSNVFLWLVLSIAFRKLLRVTKCLTGTAWWCLLLHCEGWAHHTTFFSSWQMMV